MEEGLEGFLRTELTEGITGLVAGEVPVVVDEVGEAELVGDVVSGDGTERADDLRGDIAIGIDADVGIVADDEAGEIVGMLAEVIGD